MQSISDPFRAVDYSDIPAIRHFAARDDVQLAYRYYASDAVPGKGSIVLIHGSSASSNSMHPMAREFARAGYAAYALDIRGHGASGTKGQIAYIGQLEDDLEDFVKSVQPSSPKTLVGFSSGGGFALRVGSGEHQKMFDNYVLLSPFLHQDAPTSRPGSGGWAKVGAPRIVALTILNRVGITAFNDLTVAAFALNDKAQKVLTPRYSFALSANFRPRSDYRADIRAAHQPMEVLAGANDEVFHADRFAAAFSAAGNPVPVTILPGTGHIALTLDRHALDETISAVERLNAKTGRAARPEVHDAAYR